MILLWVLWILFYAGRGISMKAAVIGGTGAVGKVARSRGMSHIEYKFWHFMYNSV